MRASSCFVTLILSITALAAPAIKVCTSVLKPRDTRLFDCSPLHLFTSSILNSEHSH
jgi:hypothetical protein